jgi:hypothetical protein
MRRFALLTAAILAAVFLWLLATLPAAPVPATGSVDEALSRRTIAGAFHVHSTRSDGFEDPDAIAAAAARAGLKFLVLTDHGDATRQPDPPAYTNGVLVIDGVEVSTNGGHYIALDMPPAPYPLGGEADAVVEDVARLGGFGIAAHPDSAKPDLRWSDPDAPVDGLEWLNLDSEWRDEPRRTLVRAAIDYTVRSAPALASILDRPTAALARWDSQAMKRRVVGLAGHDAHGGIGEEGAGGGRSSLMRVPSYESSFRTFALRATVDTGLSGVAAEDARLILDAIRAGRVFSAIDAIAGPAFIDFRAAAGGGEAAMGQVLPFAADASVTVRSTLPEGGRIVLLRDGQEVAQSFSGELRESARVPGTYRVEVRAPGAPGTPPVPWIASNPIYLRPQTSEPGPAAPAYSSVAVVSDPGTVEKDAGSLVTLSTADGRRVVDFTLAAGPRASQYAAIALTLPPAPSPFDALTFEGRSSAPMRVSVQLRFDSAGASRWARSVYLTDEVGRVVVPLNRLVPVDNRSRLPPPSTAFSILFVVDLTNASPGQSGRFEISELALSKAQGSGPRTQHTSIPVR